VVVAAALVVVAELAAQEEIIIAGLAKASPVSAPKPIVLA
jgi:hypothetical protein